MKTIRVTIAPDGKPTVEANGFQGADCKSATKPIEDAFGAKDVAVVDKPEAFLASGQSNQSGLQL